MNWGLVIDFVRSFVDGYNQGQADRARRSLGYQSPMGWGEHMQAVAQATDGIVLRSLKDNLARFGINYGGNEYVLILTRGGGGAVVLNFCSRFLFRNLPRDVMHFLAQRNRDLPNCDYDCIEDEEGSFFLVKSQIDLCNLTPGMLRAAIEEFLPCVLALDQFLVKHGHAG